ncbi:glucose 1-dehydrogenase [Bacillus sp. FJAT-29814]|uniref:glucose 1-dehydrogenase n=1 Tax=Bacillus sp. FJAT-29814 TaxID=1729688 RepID=UPI00082AD09D|nr:glucose 1-dehydrogenase [Bacillus sp. FJAT-29814]
MNTLDLFRLDGKVAIVTGGAVGLGRQMAEALAEMGANIVIASRKKEKCMEATNEISRSMDVDTLAIELDIRDEASIKQMVNDTIERFGRIDILVNNSGIAWGGPAEEVSYEDWKKVIDVNVNGTFYCTQEVGKVMIKQGGGKIVNISSIGSFGGAFPEAQDALSYNTSKGAINIFTKDLAVKWAQYNINVNAIAPGWFPTKISKFVIENRKELLMQRLPLKRFGSEADLKGAIVYLSSNASDYVTGHILVVDGGWTALM